jgi:hypothetical protein
MFSLVLSALASPNTRLRIYATQFSTKQPRRTTARTRGDSAIPSAVSAHLFKPDFSARRVVDEPGNSFLPDRTCGMSRVKNELRHRKIVRDGAQIFFGYVFAHPDSTRRGQKTDINAILYKSKLLGNRLLGRQSPKYYFWPACLRVLSLSFEFRV